MRQTDRHTGRQAGREREGGGGREAEIGESGNGRERGGRSREG